MRKKSESVRLRTAMLAGTCVFTLAMSQPARSQDAAAPGGEASNSEGRANTDERAEQGFADIIVTAERRSMNLQDTPLSVVAVTQEMVSSRGIQDLQDLANFTPNLSIAPQRGGSSATPSFAIRGIGGGGGATGERGVGLYVDGIYMPRTAGSVLRVVDIDRIEVLRGPQGTLFGRNSTGGAVRYFTKQPRLGTHEGYVEVTAGNLDRGDVVGTLNVPIGDTLAIRGQGAYLHQGGWVKRGTQENGESTDFVGRAQLLFKPDDRFSATLGFLYTHSKATGSPVVVEEFNMLPGIEGYLEGNYADWLNDAFKQAGQAPLKPYNDPRVVTGDPFRQHDLCLLDDFHPGFDAACEQFNKTRYIQGDLRMTYDLSDTVALSSTSGLSKMTFTGVIDYQQLGTEHRKLDVGSEVFYQELQLNASLFGDAIDLVTGLNYFHEKSNEQGPVINRRGSSVYPNRPNGNTNDRLLRRNDTDTEQVSNSYGAFVSATWHMTDALNFTGGLRYALDKKSIDSTELRSDDFTPAPGTNSTRVTGSHSWDQIDYRATLDYSFTPDVMVYATISKAYKAGLYSFTIADNIPGPLQSGDNVATVPPEKVRNFEIGSRMAFFDNHLIFNPTAFYMQWTNRQASRRVACVTSPTCPLGLELILQNTGDIDIYGLEVDFRLRLNDIISFNGSGSLSGVKLDEVRNGGPYLFPDIPRKQFTFGGNLNVPNPYGKFELDLNWSYTDAQNTLNVATPDAYYKLPGYNLVNARLNFRPNNAKVSITLFAQNLLNHVYATGATRFGGSYWDSAVPTGVAAPDRSMLSVVRGKPRTVGATIRYDF